ncbi:hypothetical protein PS6_006064 [Mucor atramentarius]
MSLPYLLLLELKTSTATNDDGKALNDAQPLPSDTPGSRPNNVLGTWDKTHDTNMVEANQSPNQRSTFDSYSEKNDEQMDEAESSSAKQHKDCSQLPELQNNKKTSKINGSSDVTARRNK